MELNICATVFMYGDQCHYEQSFHLAMPMLKNRWKSLLLLW